MADWQSGAETGEEQTVTEPPPQGTALDVPKEMDQTGWEGGAWRRTNHRPRDQRPSPPPWSRGNGSVAVQAPTRGDGSVAVQAPTLGDGSVAVQAPTRGDGSVAVQAPTQGDGSVAVQAPTRGDGPAATQGQGPPGTSDVEPGSEVTPLRVPPLSGAQGRRKGTSDVEPGSEVMPLRGPPLSGAQGRQTGTSDVEQGSEKTPLRGPPLSGAQGRQAGTSDLEQGSEVTPPELGAGAWEPASVERDSRCGRPLSIVRTPPEGPT